MLLVAVAAVALSACGSDSGDSASAELGGSNDSGGIVTGQVIQVPDSSDGVAFLTPSGNIGCAIESTDGDGNDVRCTILEKKYADPTDQQCDNGYRTLVIGNGAAITCSDDSVFALAEKGTSLTRWYRPDVGKLVKSSVTLGYGNSIEYLGYRCDSAESGITCLASDGNVGFRLSRARYDLYP